MRYDELTPEQQAFIQCILKKNSEFNPSANELKKLYRKLSLAWHPDKAINERSIAQRRELPGFDYLNTLVNTETGAPDEAFKVIGLLDPDGDFAKHSSLILAGARRAQSPPSSSAMPSDDGWYNSAPSRDSDWNWGHSASASSGSGAPTPHSTNPLQQRHQQILAAMQEYEFIEHGLDWDRETTEIRANKDLYMQLAYILRHTTHRAGFRGSSVEKPWAMEFSWLNPGARTQEAQSLFQQILSADVHARSTLAALINALEQQLLRRDKGRYDDFEDIHFIHRKPTFDTYLPGKLTECKFDHCDVTTPGLRILPKSHFEVLPRYSDSVRHQSSAEHSQFHIQSRSEYAVDPSTYVKTCIDLVGFDATQCSFNIDDQAQQSRNTIVTWKSKLCAFNQCTFEGDFCGTCSVSAFEAYPSHFENSTLDACDFKPKQISHFNFDHCQFTSGQINTCCTRETLISHSSFDKTAITLTAQQLTIRSSNFHDLHFSGEYTESGFIASEFSHCTVSTQFSRSDIEDCRFEHCSISGNLQDCALINTRFEHCRIDASFTQVDLESVAFVGCDLTNFADHIQAPLHSVSMHDCTVSDHHQVMRLMTQGAPIEQLNWGAECMRHLNAEDYLHTQALYRQAKTRLRSSPKKLSAFQQRFGELADSSTDLEHFSAACKMHDRCSGIIRLFQPKSNLNTLGDQLQTQLHKAEAEAKPVGAIAT